MIEARFDLATLQSARKIEGRRVDNNNKAPADIASRCFREDVAGRNAHAPLLGQSQCLKSFLIC